MKLNCHQRAIVRELKRNTETVYQAEQAHTKARERRVSCHRLETKSDEVIQIIQH